jgi:PIN domain nuclease of toxin-antitoxin system
MNLLLDTHALIWWLADSDRLGRRARNAILRPGAAVFISSASIWEISIKSALGRVKLKEPLGKCISHLVASGFHHLPINFEHALAVRDLPPHHPPYHADPFDRMLIAQAQCEDLTLMTADSAIAPYDVRTIDASA